MQAGVWREGWGDEAKVEAAFGEGGDLIIGGGGGDLGLDAEGSGEGQDPWQGLEQGERDEAYAQGRGGGACGAGEVLRALGGGEGDARLGREGAARLGEGDALGRAFEQGSAEVAFEAADGLRERRLADPEALGGAGEAAFVHHGEEMAVALQVHIEAVLKSVELILE